MHKSRSEYANSAAREYTKIVAELAEITDQLVAAEDLVTGSIVRAPVSGMLLRLSATTIGGVVGAADVVGEIVPEGAPLVVQARVQPVDIDYVHVGQDAEIAVTAFNRRIDDTIHGRVTYKSADAETDEKSGETFFTVRLALAGGQGKGRNRLSDIQAGMQAEVYNPYGFQNVPDLSGKAHDRQFQARIPRTIEGRQRDRHIRSVRVS